jgi:hypothetical protein
MGLERLRKLMYDVRLLNMVFLNYLKQFVMKFYLGRFLKLNWDGCFGETLRFIRGFMLVIKKILSSFVAGISFLLENS